MSATLGGLLKDYRLQKKLTQTGIALALGWKEASRLSRIEQGRVRKPTRKLLDKIANIMELKEEEKNHLFLVGNYLPTDAEIKQIRKEIDPFIQAWPYPITVYDFSWRVVHENTVNTKIFRSSKEQIAWIRKEKPTIFEIQFASEALQNKYLKAEELQKWHNFLLNALSQFKYAQRTRTREKWFIDLIKKMMDNALFKKLWQKAKMPSRRPLLKDYSRVTVPHPECKDKILTFDIFSVQLVIDLRFDIEFHTPADLATFLYFQKKS